MYSLHLKPQIVTICCIVLGAITCYSQKLTDKVFNNVIKIDNAHITTDGSNFLFYFSIPSDKKLPVMYLDGQIPYSLLSTAYPDLAKYIIIIPDWVYYKGVQESVKQSKITCAEPITTTIIYSFKRANGVLQKDSLVVRGNDQPVLNFASSPKPKEGEVDIYYTEEYGSVCCPRDSRWGNRRTIEKFIQHFQNKHSVKIKDIYNQVWGEEGEHTTYYTLKELSNKEKLNFIIGINHLLNKNNPAIVTKETPSIYTPRRINTSEMKKVL